MPVGVHLLKARLYIEIGNDEDIRDVSSATEDIDARAKMTGGGTVVKDRSGRATDGKTGGFFLIAMF